MIVIPQPVDLQLPTGAPRSTGVHVSGIIRAIATETGILQKEQAEELSLVDVRTITDPTVILRISIGLAWESWYIKEILCQQGVIDHPYEMKVDGIYMTHDGESLDVILSLPHLVIHEIKATYKSTNTVGELVDQWMWLAQMKAYCRGAKTRFAKLHVLFLCGDYKYPLQPQLKCWLVEFTQEEIDEAWDLLKSYRDYRQAKESGQ